MDIELKERFLERWNKYFPKAELPIVFYYSDQPDQAELLKPSSDWRCLFADLARVRNGKSIALDAVSIGCAGGKKYLGYDLEPRPYFENFLSDGIPGKMEGIRFKKSPELVRIVSKHQPEFSAPGKYIVFKRWDALETNDKPLAVIFFAIPDVLSGLYSLANFDEPDPNSVIAPSGSGCSSIVYFPYHELESDHPRAIIGMFDISARPFAPPAILSFTVPWPKFVRMVQNMDESFLITEQWNQIRIRLSR